MTVKTHGGPNRGQGRKPISPSSPTITVSIRMTKAQREKLAMRGGAKWVRAEIDNDTDWKAAYLEQVNLHNQTLDELRIAMEVWREAENLIKVKGRHNSEIAYKRLEESLK